MDFSVLTLGTLLMSLVFWLGFRGPGSGFRRGTVSHSWFEVWGEGRGSHAQRLQGL